MRETTARFIESACPLTRVRELADERTGPGADYRRQAAELGWFAMLVPEEFGGGTVSGNGVADAAVIAEERGRFLQPGAFVATNAVACALATRRQRGATREGAPVDRERRGRRHVGARVGRRRLVAGHRAARVARAAAASCSTGASGFVQDADDADWILVTASGDRGLSQFLVAGRHAGRHDPRARRARPHATVLRGPVRQRRAAVPRRWSGRTVRPRAASTRQLDVALALTVAEMVGRDGPRLRSGARLREGAHRVRAPDRVVPGGEAPARRHEPRARDEQGDGRRRGQGGGRRRRTTPPRSRAWPRRS